MSAFLAIQEQEAMWWRDATLAYFESLSGRPFPPGTLPPAHTLQEYEALSLSLRPGEPGMDRRAFSALIPCLPSRVAAGDAA